MEHQDAVNIATETMYCFKVIRMNRVVYAVELIVDASLCLHPFSFSRFSLWLEDALCVSLCI